MYYTYILQSQKTGRLYIGQTEDIEHRLLLHNSNYVTSTKNKGPWLLIHVVEFDSRSEAYQLEQKLKKWKSRVRILAWIKSSKD